MMWVCKSLEILSLFCTDILKIPTKFIGFVNSNRTELLTIGSLVLFCIPIRVTLIYLMRIGKPKATPENNKCNHMLITGLLGTLTLDQGKKC